MASDVFVCGWLKYKDMISQKHEKIMKPTNIWAGEKYIISLKGLEKGHAMVLSSETLIETNLKQGMSGKTIHSYMTYCIPLKRSWKELFNGDVYKHRFKTTRCRLLLDNEIGNYVASRKNLTFIRLEKSQRVIQVIIFA